MSSLGSPTLDLDVRSRRAEPLLVWVTLTLAIIAPALLYQLNVPLQLMLMTLGGALVAAGFWRSRSWGSRRLASILWLSDGRWRLTPGRGPALEARLLPDSRLGPGCVWLHWRCEREPVERLDRGGLPIQSVLDLLQLPASHSQTLAMLLVRGDLPAADWRRLRVRLALDPGVSRGEESLAVNAREPRNYNVLAKFDRYLADCRHWVRRRWSPPQAVLGQRGRQASRAVAARQESRQR